MDLLVDPPRLESLNTGKLPTEHSFTYYTGRRLLQDGVKLSSRTSVLAIDIVTQHGTRPPL